MKVWIYQDPKQAKKHGAARASWCVGWYDPEGRRRCKSFGAGREGKRAAKDYRARVARDLASGSYQSEITWKAFRKEFEATVLSAKRPTTRESYRYALDSFERVAKPEKLKSISARTLADFAAKRRQAPSRLGGHLSPASINRELRHVRAALRTAKRWGYLHSVPAFEFEKQPKRLPAYVTHEHFVAMWASADAARYPNDLANGVTAGEWWRGLLITALLTGWRIGSLLALKWKDVDLDAGTALSQADDNKGGRDQLTPIHPLAVTHLRPLQRTFDSHVFPFNRGRRRLWDELQRIQKAAGVEPGRKPFYGFHDLRRAFATFNATRMTADALQGLMGHRDYQTTQAYINLARQLRPAVEDLFVPELPDPDQPKEQKA